MSRSVNILIFHEKVTHQFIMREITSIYLNKWEWNEWIEWVKLCKQAWAFMFNTHSPFDVGERMWCVCITFDETFFFILSFRFLLPPRVRRTTCGATYLRFARSQDNQGWLNATPLDWRPEQMFDTYGRFFFLSRLTAAVWMRSPGKMCTHTIVIERELLIKIMISCALNTLSHRNHQHNKDTTN